MIQIQTKIKVASITNRPYRLENGTEGVSYSVVSFDDNGYPESFKITEDVAKVIEPNNTYILEGTLGYFNSKLTARFTKIIK